MKRSLSSSIRGPSATSSASGFNPHPAWPVALLWAALLWTSVALAEPTPRIFPTPEAAVVALADAVQAADGTAVRNLFGLEADHLVAADQVQITNEFKLFTTAYREHHRLVEESDTRRVLEVGAGSWPFPIPIVKGTAGWFFDSKAGLDEVLNRRIGRNELEALAVVRAYVDAQREYANRDRDSDDVLEFAQKFTSSEGLKDGLYWPETLDGEISPLGPLAAHAYQEGYRRQSSDGTPEPFHGYLFRVLKAQGPHAAGGKHPYVINGNMIAGFALVAWPAQYGESGVMTFIVNQQGRVYQRDLGPKTARIVSSMKRYDPGSDWYPSPE